MGAVTSIIEMAMGFGHHLMSSLFFGLLPIVVIGLSIGWLAIRLAAGNAGIVDRRAITAFAVVGATAGLMIGSSRSPIIHVALPALLTLVTTFLAYLYAKEKPSKEAQDKGEELLRSFKDKDGPDVTKAKQEALNDILGRVQFIPAGILALTLASGGGAFFGSSMRAVAEENDRNYQEWLLAYEKVELPLNADLLRKKAGLPLKGAEADGKPETDTAEKAQ
ncbi:hypothetical protein GR138_17290 [Shinella kummerowiae]|uniref:Uncharacterized protein n=1 Tax=Shinella kummerowiae TaxID=417745 RepID=A0A6N8SE47_9HYPH|nr:hypothetical protein [Shinella kummerowiae]MXN46951.1 hypothetical protein [Shinella kummerowiae]